MNALMSLAMRIAGVLATAGAMLALVVPEALAVPVLAPLDRLSLSRATGLPGVFQDVYEFELSERSSLTYGTTRWRLASRAISGFDADLYSLPDTDLLETGSDFLGTSPLVVNNRFFADDLDPGLYRLVISGTDAGGGYSGALFVSPFVEQAAARGAPMPEPASTALLGAGLLATLVLRRRTLHRPRN